MSKLVIPAHRLIFRPLGREVAHGLCEARTITLDPRAPNLLKVYLHEIQHVLHPGWSEHKVEKEAKTLTKVLCWRDRARLYKALGRAHIGAVESQAS